MKPRWVGEAVWTGVCLGIVTAAFIVAMVVAAAAGKG